MRLPIIRADLIPLVIEIVEAALAIHGLLLGPTSGGCVARIVCVDDFRVGAVSLIPLASFRRTRLLGAANVRLPSRSLTAVNLVDFPP